MIYWDKVILNMINAINYDLNQQKKSENLYLQKKIQANSPLIIFYIA